MDTVEAVFQIPDWIANGLGNGTYERVGGVIREVDSKSVVAWLRETDFTQVSPGQVISSASRLLKFGDAVGVLNLGVSVAGFAIILNRIKHLETAISEQNALLTQIDRKLDLGFYGNFVAAIRQANDAMMMQNPDTKRIGAMQAVNRMLEAQHYFETICEAEIASSNEITDKLISTLFLAYTAEIRCHMELGEMALAASKLEHYSETMKTLVQSYLEVSYASFDTDHLWCVPDYLVQAKGIKTLEVRIRELEVVLRKDVKKHKIFSEASASDVYKKQQSDLNRVVQNLSKTKQNLAQAQTQTGFFAIAKVSYWNIEVAADESMVISTRRDIDRYRRQKQQYYAQTLPELLTRADGVIEDMRRFEAYQDEVAALQQTGVNLSEWQKIRPRDVPKSQNANMFLVVPARS
jgi:hypothetical protein